MAKGEVGASEEYLAAVCAEARRKQPCLIIMDEIQALFGSRDKGNETHSTLVSQLLTELDNMPDGVCVVGTTSSIDLLDAALLRPGRLEHRIHVGLPDAPTRLALLEHLQSQSIWNITDDDMRQLIADTIGYSCAEIIALANNASILAISEYDDNTDSLCVYRSHFEAAKKQLRSS